MARRTTNKAPVESLEAEVEEAAPVEASEPEPEAAVLIRCEKFPSLLVTSPHVEFVDGLATVPEDVAAILLKLSPEFGLARVDPADE